MELKKPERLATRIVYHGRKMEFIEEDLKFPDGHIETWEHVNLRGKGVKVLALTAQKELIMVSEYRGAAGKYVLRIPTGAIEPDEEPEEAVVRELQEEVGFRPRKLVFLEEQKPMSSFFKSHAFVYVASDLERSSLERDPGEKDMQVVLLSLDKVYEMVDNLEIEDPQTIYAILTLKKFLRTNAI